MADERDSRDVWASCERVLAGFDPQSRDPRTALLALAERAPREIESDRYGGGELAERLEARVAELLGKEAAVWMPSGTMAQQIAGSRRAIARVGRPRRDLCRRARARLGAAPRRSTIVAVHVVL
jgi:hypothetical protein